LAALERASSGNQPTITHDLPTCGGLRHPRPLGALEMALGVPLLLTSDVDPRLLAPIAAAWGAVSGTLLLAQGLRLRHYARTWQTPGTPPQNP
jgi:hypothetical protein